MAVRDRSKESATILTREKSCIAIGSPSSIYLGCVYSIYLFVCVEYSGAEYRMFSSQCEILTIMHVGMFVAIV